MLLLTKKKKHNLKVENCVLFGGQTEDLSPDTASQIASSETASREVREEPGYIVVSATKTR